MRNGGFLGAFEGVWGPGNGGVGAKGRKGVKVGQNAPQEENLAFSCGVIFFLAREKSEG